MAKCLMGVDIGSYESKGTLTDLNGTVIATTSLKHELDFLGDGFVEQDAEKVWWGEFVSITQTLIKESSIDPSDVAALGLSGVFSMLPIDEDANPLRTGGIMYGVDTRSVKEIETVLNWHDEPDLIRRTGNGITTQSMGPKILWLKNNEPDVYQNAASFLPCANFIAARLTGNFVIDHFSAGFFGPLYEPSKGNWAEDLCKGIVEPERLPQVKWASELAGTVTEKAAAMTGLAVGTPVTVGTSDVATEALSIGVRSPGDMMLMYGSTAWISLIMEKPLYNDKLWASPFLFPDTYCLHGGMATSGSLTRWMRDMIGSELVEVEQQGGESAYQELTRQAESTPAGADGLVVLPYFSGERTPIQDPNAKGVIFGLTMNHTKGHLFRAALEGVGYSIQHTLQTMNQAGASAEKISAVGGGTKSPVWLQAVSDITGVPQDIPSVTFGASYGNAFLAGFAAGLIPSQDEIQRWVNVSHRVKPNPDNEATYKELMNKYLILYPRTADLM